LPGKPSALPGPLHKEEKAPAGGKAQLQADLGFSPRNDLPENDSPRSPLPIPHTKTQGEKSGLATQAAAPEKRKDDALSGWDSEEDGPGKPAAKLEVPAAGHAAEAQASGWDSEEEQTKKSIKKKPTQQEIPVEGQVAMAAPSGWDSDEESKKEKKPAEQKPPPPKKAVSKTLAALVKCEDCGRSFNCESIEKHRRVCKQVFQQKREKFNSAANRLDEFVSRGEMIQTGDKVEKAPDTIPDGPVKGNRESAAPSGFDSDEEGRSPKQAQPASEDHKGGMAMEFDMGEGPRKAMPKALAARLSKKKSKKTTKITCQDRGGAASPKKPDPAASGWDSDEEKKEAAPTDACGAPQQRPDAKAFVAAKPKPAPSQDLKGQGELGDLLSEVLSADTSVPFKGSDNHAFVPNFYCMGCDHEVLRIDRYVWKDDVAYMFLRNNYPNVMKLRPQLKFQEGSCAYCCQCSSRSADSSAALEDVAEGLRWRVIQA